MTTVDSATPARAAFYLVAGDRAACPLAAVKQFMTDNNAVIMMVVLLLLGAKLLGDGLAALWGRPVQWPDSRDQPRAER